MHFMRYKECIKCIKAPHQDLSRCRLVAVITIRKYKTAYYAYFLGKEYVFAKNTKKQRHLRHRDDSTSVGSALSSDLNAIILFPHSVIFAIYHFPHII